MATIRPFMGIRPAPEYAKDVAALPYDVMNTEEAREMVKGNPYSFLHIDRRKSICPWVQTLTAPLFMKKQEILSMNSWTKAFSHRICCPICISID